MSFISDLKVKQDGSKKSASSAQKAAASALPPQKVMIFEETLNRAGLSTATPDDQYKNLKKILEKRNEISSDIAAAGLNEDVSVIGGVTELICEIGLKASVEDRYSRLPSSWNWLGDFAVTGLPFNLYISVKSYYARERLIASGTGQGAAPIIGYGLFKDESEWNPNRVKSYRHRGFIAIYMPSDLLKKLSPDAIKVVNTYDRPMLRDVKDFAKDLKKVVKKDLVIDLRKF